jgi:hypothetical protein
MSGKGSERASQAAIQPVQFAFLAPKPTAERNGCNLKPLKPEVQEKALLLVVSFPLLPLRVVCLGHHCFPILEQEETEKTEESSSVASVSSCSALAHLSTSDPNGNAAWGDDQSLRANGRIREYVTNFFHL